MNETKTLQISGVKIFYDTTILDTHTGPEHERKREREKEKKNTIELNAKQQQQRSWSLRMFLNSGRDFH